MGVILLLIILFIISTTLFIISCKIGYCDDI